MRWGGKWGGQSVKLVRKQDNIDYWVLKDLWKGPYSWDEKSEEKVFQCHECNVRNECNMMDGHQETFVLGQESQKV